MRFRSNKGQAGIAARVVLLLGCANVLTGCGEIAFKRGSGPDAFAADRRRCRSETADPAGVRACLARAGWHVTDMDAGAAPVAAPSPAPPVPAPAPEAAMAVSAPAAPPPKATAKTLIIGTWWKLGSGGADLRAAGDACVAKLGPANAPDAGYHTVTPALYACLRQSGWHGQVRSAN